MKYIPQQNFPEKQNQLEKHFSKFWTYFMANIFIKKIIYFLPWKKNRTTSYEKKNSNSFPNFLGMCL